jgi:hypothetical protein
MRRLGKKILNLLRENPDVHKIERILQSELLVTYGLFSDEFDSNALSREIMDWWGREGAGTGSPCL